MLIAIYKCRSCGLNSTTEYKRCPKCGSKMLKRYITNDNPLSDNPVFDTTAPKSKYPKWCDVTAIGKSYFENYALPELADKLNITHDELIKIYNFDPDRLDRLIEELIK